jgi:hypothetical protein
VEDRKHPSLTLRQQVLALLPGGGSKPDSVVQEAVEVLDKNQALNNSVLIIMQIYIASSGLFREFYDNNNIYMKKIIAYLGGGRYDGNEHYYAG